jgi:amidohydrolase
MEGTVRTLDPAVRRRMREDMLRITEGISAAHGVTCQVRWFEGPPALYNDAELCRIAREEAQKLGLRVDRQEDTMGGEDFAEFLVWPRQRPGLFVRIGTGGGFANHHPQFTADPAALWQASCLLRELTLRLMRRD